MVRTLPLLIVVALAATAPAADRITTRFDLETGVGETVLGNGLRLLTLERHSAPVVSCQIWYRVGSADEVTGETGLAHFLEHLLFKGTDRYEKGEIDRITLKLGGSNNAATYKDWTYYFFNFASDRWETSLAIEANRMRNVTFDPKELEAERKVVIEELQIGRDGPWGELDETLEAACFLTHPYHHPVIGWRQDLERVPRERVKAFYDLHYHPRNATLVIVGDFDTRRAVSRVNDIFGPIPAGPERPPRRFKEPEQNGERRIVIHRDAALARLQVMYHSVAARHSDDAVLDVIQRLLVGGKAARLTRRLEEEEHLVTFVRAANDTRMDPGVFWIWAEVKEGEDPARVEKLIHEETSRLATEAALEKELSRAKKAILVEQIFERATAEGSAEQLGHLSSVADWHLVGTLEERIRAVTAADVRRVARTTFRPANRSVGLAMPGGGDAGGGGGSGDRAPPRRSASRGEAANAGGVAVRLSPTVVRLSNGLTLLLARNSTVPVLALSAFVNAGRLRQDSPGLGHLTGQYLLEGAGGRSAIELAEEIERLGATVKTRSTGLSARSLSTDAAELVALVADILRRPKLPESALEKLREKIISEIQADLDDPQTLARREFDRLVFGGHPFAHPVRGTVESLRAVTREAVLDHHSRRYSPGNTVIAAVSDLAPEEILDLLEKEFGDWEAISDAHHENRPAPEPKPQTKSVVRETDQVNVYLGHRGIRRSDPDYYSLLVMDYVLGMGPGFTDRLSRTIRDRDGLAYNVYATIARAARLEPGAFFAYVGTSASQKDRAIEAIVREIERIRREPVDPDELADAKAYLTGAFVFDFETAEQMAEKLVEMHRYELGFDYPARFAKRVNAVTGEDVLRVAKKHLHPDKLTIVTVGP